MKKTILAYRDNELWKELGDAILSRSTKIAEESDSQIIVKVFEPKDQEDDIDSWIESLDEEGEIVKTITDGTVANRLKSKGFEINYRSNKNLNDYLSISFGYKSPNMSLEELHKVVYSRVAEAIKPDLWVIVTNNLCDYDPFGIMGSEKYGDDVSDQERDAYVEKFRSLIPDNQTVEVFPYAPYNRPEKTFDRSVTGGKKVVLICHHHAANHFDPDILDGTKEGSLCLDTYPSSFIRSVGDVIRVDDLLTENIIEQMRERIQKGGK